MLKLEADENSQLWKVLYHLDELQTTLCLLVGVVLGTFHKGLRKFKLYNVVDESVLESDALEVCDNSASGLPMFLADFSASSGTIL